jgi:hypothetical protein
MKRDKVFKVFYRKRGQDKPISYIWLKATNIKEAKADARSHVWLSMKDTRGAVQINAYMKSIVFYIAK